MNRNVKRVIATLLCVIMTFSFCTPAFAVSQKTEQYVKKAAAVGIQKAAGAIPVVGDTISGIIGEFLPDMLGLPGEHDQIMAKLDEISDAINDLSLKIDDNQRQLFQKFYQDKIDEFNSSANELKGTIDLLYTLMAGIEDEYGNDESRLNEKQVMLANLIKSNELGEYAINVSKLINTTDYICGTQISTGKEDGIFQLAYKANCADSVLGCEAAIKSSAYVNALSQYMDIAYKTLFNIYAAKIYVCENCNEISAEMAAGKIKKCDLTDYDPYTGNIIKKAIFGSNSASLLEYYRKLFDESRSNSAINVYNNMIEDTWFCYIAGTDYTQKQAKISYIELDPEMGFIAPGEACHTNPLGQKIDYAYGADLVKSLKKQTSSDRYGVVKNTCSIVDKEMMDTAHAALSPEQIDRLIQHMAHNPAFGTDDEELSFICVLDELGFSFAEYNAYIDSLPKSGLGTSYKDPSLPKAQTDGKYKIMPTGTAYYYDGKNNVAKGWFSDQATGYGLQESLNDSNVQTSAEMIRICFDTVNNNDSLGDYFINNTILLYLKKPEGSFIASIFGDMSPAAIPIICVGAAVVIALPIVLIAVKKRKKKAAGSASDAA